MVRIAAYLLVGIGVGLGFAVWQGAGRSGADPDSGFSFEERAPLERRLSELETSLALERYERQALADELDALKVSVSAMPATAANADAPGNPRDRIAAFLDPNNEGNPIADRIRERFPNGVPQTPEEIEQFTRQRQLDRFVGAGLSLERAQWILQREDELQMEVLQSRYEAAQNGASPEEVANLNTASVMRQELGDTDYEKYLQGQGRPTSVNVRDVLTNSPAQSAGLKAGDQIVAYNGRRVFDMNELNELTNEARPGATVALEVVRDGQPMQVYVQSGPIGISGGGRSTRRGGAGGGFPGNR
jgi:hypothetical protein